MAGKPQKPTRSTASKPKPTSLREYARRRGVSAEAVSKAIDDGRLRESVARDGRGAPKIADVELADREWDRNTRPRIDHAPAVTAAAPRCEDDAVEADYHAARSRREVAAARREAAIAEMAELELAELRGDMIEVEKARADVLAKFTLVRTRILGVPSRVAQRLPALAPEVVPVLEELLREALEELADGGDDGDGQVVDGDAGGE